MSEATIHNINMFKAHQLVEDGKHHISTGDLDLAIETFQRSIEAEPTSEALTYLGWVFSLKGKTDEAIDLCKQAVLLDPDFGNPYNDIGSYLIKKGAPDEAVPWLEKAKLAKNYEPKHFPYINLGRIYSTQGRIEEAIVEFKKALEFAPDHPEIGKVLEQLENLKNRPH